jgi:glycopeptide antibiotics resistance protein
LWGLFHWPFGAGNIIVLIPALIFVPYVTQKSRNTWTGIILHAVLSGPGFIALAFGIIA